MWSLDSMPFTGFQALITGLQLDPTLNITIYVVLYYFNIVFPSTLIAHT